MQVRIVRLTVRRSGAKARREQVLDVGALSVGRGTDNDLVLNELTVSLHHARFELRGEGVYAVPGDPGELLVNGQVTGAERVEPGDVVRVGTFELRVAAGVGDEALALEVEEIGRRGDEREDLARRTRVGVEGGVLARRRLSVSLAVLVVALFLVVPLLTGRFEGAWNSGSISRKHAFIADDCQACHRGFERVGDDGCLGCHGSIARHASAEASPASLEGARCASCHIEHNGAAGLADIDEPLCEGCHADLRSLVPRTALADASDFGSDHPEFRLYLVTEPGSGRREPAAWSPELREHPGVRFSHLRHVGEVVRRPGEKGAHLRCDACHRPDAGGRAMQPIAFEEHCQDCHVLEFDPDFAGAQALHGDPVRMREQLRGLYSERALKGEEKSEQAPPFVRFLRPGQSLTPQQAEIVYSWVEERVALAEAHLMRKDGECTRCHELLPGRAADGGTAVAPVEVPELWMPKSEFRHETHGPFPCRDCHAAAAAYQADPDGRVERPAWSRPGAGPYALFTPAELAGAHGLEPSRSSGDVLIPGIGQCRTCHAGPGAGAPYVPSPCVLCHPFHRPENGPMRQRSAQRAENALPTSKRHMVDSRRVHPPPHVRAAADAGAEG